MQIIINNIKTDYTINEDGEIYNIKTKKKLTGSIKKNGYKSVKLTINGHKKDYFVHRLVAITFLPNPLNLPQVNHKDCNKLNNNVNNLEWVTASENVLHCIAFGKKSRKKQRRFNNLTDKLNWKQYLSTNYWLSTDGQCINLKTGKYLNPSVTSGGYLRYYLYINQRRIPKFAHRLVYETFHPQEMLTSDEQINHIDGNKQNNKLENLEKVTCKENVQYNYLYLKPNNQVQICQYDLNDNLIAKFLSLSEAARQFGGCAAGYSLATNGKIKTYLGYKWRKVQRPSERSRTKPSEMETSIQYR